MPYPSRVHSGAAAGARETSSTDPGRVPLSLSGTPTQTPCTSDALSAGEARAAAAAVFPRSKLTQLAEGQHSVVFTADQAGGVGPTSIVRVRRKPQQPFPWRFYRSLLAGGAPLVSLHGRPLEQNGYEFSAAEYLQPGPVAQGGYIRALIALHSRPSGPSVPPKWDWLERTSHELREARGVHGELLAGVFDQVKRDLRRAGMGRVSVLHGDPHGDNIGIAADGHPKWFDLDDLCVGPVAWDWSSAIFIARRFGDSRRDLDRLTSAAEQDCGSAAVLNQMVALRELNLLLAGFRLLGPEHHTEMMHRLRTLQDGDRDAPWALIDDL